jgi:hypothetical protein
MDKRRHRKTSRRAGSTLRHRHSLGDWEKSLIVRYYVEKDMTIEATMDVMKRKHRFHARSVGSPLTGVFDHKLTVSAQETSIPDENQQSLEAA